ncbi:hypothetical protein REPUB_Repub17cG0105400 [Reevesia pubescens]
MSAYKFQLNLQHELTHQNVDAEGETYKKLWSRIWNAKVPTKIKNFSWKMALGFLPVFWNLYKKKIINCTTCVRCGQLEETICHAIWDCVFPRECWKLSSLLEVWQLDETQSLLQWFAGSASSWIQSSFDKGMVLAWAIWGSRNDEVKNNVKNTPVSTSPFALQYIEVFVKAQQHIGFCGAPMEIRWQRPKQGFVKVNFDGAVSIAEGTGGSGVIIRDEEGSVLGACSVFHFGLQNPEIVEASAALVALSFAANMGFQQIIVEGDAARVVSLLQKQRADSFIIHNLITDCSWQVAKFHVVEFSHVKRDANTIADSLAKFALSSKNNSYWIEEYPSFVDHLVVSDCNNT